MPDTKTQFDKALPSNDEAERVILGAVLIDDAAIEAAVESLEAGDFYSLTNRRVFEAMTELHRERKVIDPITVGEILRRDGSLEGVGGVSAIKNLSLGLPFFQNIDHYVEIVREKAALRRLVKECGALISLAMAEEEPAPAILTAAQNRINDLCLKAQEGKAEERFVSLEKILKTDFVKTLEVLRGGKTSKISTGFPSIDLVIGGGLSLSDVLLIGADTGAGKSALALQMAYQIAEAGVPVAFLAGEMTNSENVNRLVSQVAGFTNLNWVQTIREHDVELLSQWAAAIAKVPMYFDHKTSDLATLGTYMRSMVRRQGVRVLVIDYIQLFKLDKVEKRKRIERIADASQEVKRIANELSIAVIEVAQFNRQGAKAERATLHDFEGSGQLEKDASVIMLLELSDGDYRDSTGQKFRSAKIRIDKGRNVGKSEIEGRFYAPMLKFEFE